MTATWIYVTAGSKDEALSIGRLLVEERLAACANVIPGTTAIYWWEGKVQEGAEAVLILKTRSDLVDAATARIRSVHSYTCPCVLALPVADGNRDFLTWIVNETRQ
ncbi:MAG: divalent-cation tolerance protein CutA [Rhodospirillales bacterium]|nr:divalent-cation tolerance protein CutA [Rhodospirillales bacterium]